MEQLSWKIIDKYCKDNPDFLVQHHLDSYNDFFKNGIPRIFKEKNPIIINPNQSIYEIMSILKDFVGESIPVVNDEKKLIGIISENDVLKAYDQITQTIRNIEKN